MAAANKRTFADTAKSGDRPLPKQPAKRKPAKRKQVDDGVITADQIARSTAGVAERSLTKAERARERRKTHAHLSVEVSIEQKAELLAAAQAAGVSLGELVRRRLFGEPS